MTLEELVSAIEQKNKLEGSTLNPPATQRQIDEFQQTIGFPLPHDFVEFYKICNGFCCDEDIFNMTSIEDIVQYSDNHGHNWFHFSEYMISSDLWSLRIKSDGQYEIFNLGSVEVVLTSSLREFLEHFLQGNIFGKGGIYDWQEQLKRREIFTVRDAGDGVQLQMESQRIEATTKSSQVKLSLQDKFKNWFQKLF